MYEKLSKKTLGFFYIKRFLVTLIFLVSGIVLMWIFEEDFSKNVIKTMAVIYLSYVLISFIFEPLICYELYRYKIEKEGLEVKEGLLFRKRTIILLERIQKADINMGFLHRLFGIADVTIYTSGEEFKIKCIDKEISKQILEFIRNNKN